MFSTTEIDRTKFREIIPEDAERVMKKITSTIPKTIFGPDRVSFLIENFHTITFEERTLLIEVMNNLLKVMVDREASDIEVGGYGTEGYVWIRVYGKKEPLEELPRFNDDESALLILSILNDKATEFFRRSKKPRFFLYIGLCK